MTETIKPARCAQCGYEDTPEQVDNVWQCGKCGGHHFVPIVPSEPEPKPFDDCR